MILPWKRLKGSEGAAADMVPDGLGNHATFTEFYRMASRQGMSNPGLSGPAKQAKRKEQKTGRMVYALAAILVLDLVVMLLPLPSLPFIGTWSTTYAFAAGTVVVMAGLVYVSHGVARGFSDALQHLDERTEVLDASLKSLEQKVSQQYADFSMKVGSLEKTVAGTTAGIEELKYALPSLGKGASESGRRSIEVAEKISALQGSLDGMATKLSGLEKTESEIAKALDVLDYRTGAFEESSASLAKTVNTVGTTGMETEKRVAEFGELLSTMEESFGKVESRLAGLEKKSAGTAEVLEDAARTGDSLSRLEKTIDKMGERLEKLPKVEAGLSQLEKSLSKIDSRLEKTAGRQGGRPASGRRAKRGAWEVDTPLTRSAETDAAAASAEVEPESDGTSSTGSDSQ